MNSYKIRYYNKETNKIINSTIPAYSIHGLLRNFREQYKKCVVLSVSVADEDEVLNKLGTSTKEQQNNIPTTNFPFKQ